MSPAQWIDLITKLAWPVVGLAALVYIWRSDAINKLLTISESVKGLKEQLNELVDIEKKLGLSIANINEVNASIAQIDSNFQDMKADVQSIRDRVDQPAGSTASEGSSPANDADPRSMFEEMDRAWSGVNKALSDKFGWLDWRKTGSEAYGLAHGNRRGPKLTYEMADEVARLHSAIKSYRRRQSTISDWLTREIEDEFVQSCDDIVDEIGKIR